MDEFGRPPSPTPVGGRAAGQLGALSGVRILAVEQMLALPYATQLLGLMGADVVKIEPIEGEAGRASRPLIGPEDNQVGLVFARGSLGKRSVALDLKSTEGRQLFLDLVPHFDIVAENLRPGALERLDLGFDVLARLKSDIVLLTLSGFGKTGASPYRQWPAYGPVVEIMAGLNLLGREPDDPLAPGTFGALGDIIAGIFGSLAMLAALRLRDITGEAQHADVSMLDATMSLLDSAPMIAAMGLPPATASGQGTGIGTTFAAQDGRFVVWCIREHMFSRLAQVIGHPEWITDPRLARREQWAGELDLIIRPGVEAWAASLDSGTAARLLAEAGVASGPVHHPGQLRHNPHVVDRQMLLSLEYPTGSAPLPVIGNPVKIVGAREDPDTSLPEIGQHTAVILRDELGLSDTDIAELSARGVIGTG